MGGFGLTYLAFFIWNVVTTGWLYHAKNPDGNNSLFGSCNSCYCQFFIDEFGFSTVLLV